ncbi:YsnF/AvaK domain-containing protein [Pseudomonas capeferrum]|uniref:YsnF/AvaK domain-containing protein n=1 Tax=Pseudomonas capeferrum TaxID=1495066 RepID=UPI0015E3B102|nr:YsnF/AvaK domain-containing protein [Pseudomonas capeferrum]MBA1200713.1 YsnF/AvaK domain-containing protein [Pseudomonas capeferrum]
MTHTLVAAFDNLSEAQAAKQQLLSKQILESDIQISSSSLDAPQNSTDTTDLRHEHDESFMDKVSHFFGSLFGTDEDDKPHRHGRAYPEAYRRGATLLTVTVATDELGEEAEEILERNGAIDIDERSRTWTDSSWDYEGTSGTYASGVAGVQDTTTTHLAGTHQGTDHAEVVDRRVEDPTGRTAIPVIEEDLRVGKREVNTGRVRVVSRVTERPVEETVNLHEEHAHIERRPVDRAASASELNSFKAGSIEIQETAEEVVVEKSARVVEEVTVGKESSDRQETVRDTVRRTDVDVETDHDSLTRDKNVDPLTGRLKDR